MYPTYDFKNISNTFPLSLYVISTSQRYATRSQVISNSTRSVRPLHVLLPFYEQFPLRARSSPFKFTLRSRFLLQNVSFASTFFLPACLLFQYILFQILSCSSSNLSQYVLSHSEGLRYYKVCFESCAQCTAWPRGVCEWQTRSKRTKIETRRRCEVTSGWQARLRLFQEPPSPLLLSLLLLLQHRYNFSALFMACSVMRLRNFEFPIYFLYVACLRGISVSSWRWLLMVCLCCRFRSLTLDTCFNVVMLLFWYSFLVTADTVDE